MKPQTESRWNTLARECVAARSLADESRALSALFAAMKPYLRTVAYRYQPGDVAGAEVDLQSVVYRCIKKLRRTRMDFTKYVTTALARHTFDVRRHRRVPVVRALESAVRIDESEEARRLVDDLVVVPERGRFFELRDPRLVAFCLTEATEMDILLLKLLFNGYNAAEIARDVFGVHRATMVRRVDDLFRRVRACNKRPPKDVFRING